MEVCEGQSSLVSTSQKLGKKWLLNQTGTVAAIALLTGYISAFSAALQPAVAQTASPSSSSVEPSVEVEPESLPLYSPEAPAAEPEQRTEPEPEQRTEPELPSRSTSESRFDDRSEPSASEAQPEWLPFDPPQTAPAQAEYSAPAVPVNTPEQPEPEPDPDEFPPNPLEEPIGSDPLLPRLVVERPLSPQERSLLTAALDELQQQAVAKLQTGDAAGAFDIWNRELRLRRVLGIPDEVASLSRVGEIAWRENQTTEVRIITQRLQQIQVEVEAKTPVDYDMLLTIAQAYQKMRAIDPAVGLYNQVLAQARQRQNRGLEQRTLVNLGELHLAWFDFTSAAPVYQDLVQIVRERGNRLKEIEYLRQLAYIYQQNNQPEQAIEVQRQLVSVYESQQQYTEIPPVKMAIGDAYLLLNRPDLAAPSYQEAFAVARSGQQYGYAGDALQRLAELYRSLERLDDALVVYQLLLDVRQQTYDTVGIMNAYDQIGQVHRVRGNNPQAIASFQRALQLAQQLSYTNKVSYFTAQIQEASQPQPQ